MEIPLSQISCDEYALTETLDPKQLSSTVDCVRNVFT
jgi:hypothetical protein